MARPFTREQALENRALITALEASGNIRAAARAIGRATDHTAQLARDAEDSVLASVPRHAAWEAAQRSRHAPGAPKLPALDQVTGWSRADPAKTPHDPTRALFGGWRLKDWEGCEKDKANGS